MKTREDLYKLAYDSPIINHTLMCVDKYGISFEEALLEMVFAFYEKSTELECILMRTLGSITYPPQVISIDNRPMSPGQEKQIKELIDGHFTSKRLVDDLTSRTGCIHE